MTEVSLAKANKLRNLLKDVVLFRIESAMNENRSVTLAAYEPLSAVETKYNEIAATFLKLVADRTLVITNIAKLRKLISTVNEKNGVNELMADIAFVHNELKFWKAYIPIANSTKTPAEIATFLLHENEKTAGAAPTYRSNNGLHNFHVIAEGMSQKDLSDSITNLEAFARTLEETRNTKNYGISVSLDDDLVKVLETFKLL